MRYSPYIGFIHFIGDFFLLNLSFSCAYLLEFESFHVISNVPYFSFLLFLNLSWMGLVYLFRPYRISRVSGASKIIKYHVSIITLHLLLATFFLTFQNKLVYSNEFLLLLFIIFYVLVAVWKLLLLSFLKFYRKKGFNYKKVVIAGHGKLSHKLTRFFSHHPEHGYRLLGIFDNRANDKFSLLGDFDAIENYALENQVDEIYCCLPYINNIQVKQLIKFGEENQVSVKLITDLVAYSSKSLELERYDQLPVISVSSIPLDNPENRVYKRAFDIFFSAFVIVFFLTWMLPLIAFLIKISSKGPVFFKQKRTGKDNHEFWCYKFRTMKLNNQADSLQASHNDPRITKIGWILRTTWMDELPQFFNVFIGNMSVVGPRPHMLKHTKEFSQKVDKYMSRHAIKPGITGLAQAKGYRGEIHNISSLVNRVKLDRFYVENWSLSFDMKIILLTIQSLLFINLREEKVGAKI